MSRVAIGTPSLDDPRGFHQTMGNRQAQVFTHRAFIFPPLMASAATMLHQAGHDVLWLDGDAEEFTPAEYHDRLVTFQPDVVVWEVKTPSIVGTWQQIRALKQLLPDCLAVLVGDHVSALPHESFERSPVDIIATGGDYDYTVSEIVAHIATSREIRGVYAGHTNHDLSTVPIPNRPLCKWWRYSNHGSGNYRRRFATHSAWSRDCWWRHHKGCTFCSWTNTNFFPNYRRVSVDRAMTEVEACAAMGITELFDDSGTFPIGEWLHDFCRQLRRWNNGKRGDAASMMLGCNLRPGGLTREEYQTLGASGFRFVLFGMESANQTTLDRLNKGQSPGDLERSVRWATDAGLHPHVTIMLGYPWESQAEAERTVSMARHLFAKGWIRTLQCTVCVPYPGTELYHQCLENDWLKYVPGDWNAWDMRRPVMRTDMDDETLLALVRSVYTSYCTPRNLLRQLRELATRDGRRFLWRGAQYFFGHLTDFAGVVA